MINIPQHIALILETNEQLNIELLEAKRELKSLVLDNMLNSMGISQEDKEKIKLYMEGNG